MRTLEIGGKGLFLGKKRVLEYMQTAFGQDGAKAGSLANHMQFQPIPDISRRRQDRLDPLARLRDEQRRLGPAALRERVSQGQRRLEDQPALTGPFTMYTSWDGWGKCALNNTWPDKFDPPPDLPPSTIYLTYPAYYIIPFHYPNPVTGKLFPILESGHRRPCRPSGHDGAGAVALRVGRLADGTQPIGEPPKE